jgi:Ca2+/H+ antiporter, TMEM165/GDT1 family
MEAVLLVFGLVFVAELGDKSQLLALTMASRHATRRVVAGLVIANVVTQTLSVAAGGLLGTLVHGPAVGVLAGLVFLAFAAVTLLRGEREVEEDDAARTRSAGGVVTTVAASVIVAELGDKTMVVTMALAASQGVVAAWAGSVAGMTAAGLIGVVLGRSLGRWVSPRLLRIGSAVLFAGFGVAFLVAAALMP